MSRRVTTETPPRRRNLVARAARLKRPGRAGPHGKSRKAGRRLDNQRLAQEVRERDE